MTENVEFLKGCADLGISLSGIFESFYQAADDKVNADKARAFGKFAEGAKELLDAFD